MKDYAEVNDKYVSINGIGQYCPHRGVHCGLWCPKCYIVEDRNTVHGEPHYLSGRKLITCGQVVHIKETK